MIWSMVTGVEWNGKPVRCRPKPHPETALSILRQLSIPPQEAIFIGDTVADMMTGKKAGLALTIGILEGGITPREELEKVADVVLDSIRELKFFSFGSQ
jgi:phosphoglycolate phosphatase-like HAD superfamily hydrolase